MSQEGSFAAATLRKQADEFRSKQTSAQYTAVIEEAKAAAAKGEYSISYYGPLSEETKNKLTIEGFDVDYKSAMNESWYAISW